MARIVFVTGAAGFIGSFLVKKLLKDTDNIIVGLDNVNSYYDPGIKEARLRMLAEADVNDRFTFVRGDLCDAALIERLFAENDFDVVVNLAAQAGVRYSIENPKAYIDSNLIGFFNILEACRHHPVKHLVYASSSSVYGGNKKVPFSEEDRVDSPVSLYAATKNLTSLWPTRIRSCTPFLAPACDSSRYMARWGVPIWRTLALLTSWFVARKSRFSIWATASVTLRM